MSIILATKAGGNFDLLLLEGGTLPVQTINQTVSVGSRNSALGPNAPTTITANAPPSQAVQWSSVESGPQGPNVTVTPRLTGDLTATAVVNVTNPTGGPLVLTAAITQGGVASTPLSATTVPAGASASVSLLLPFSTGNPLGTPVNMGVAVSGNGLQLTAQGSAISVTEQPVAG